MKTAGQRAHPGTHGYRQSEKRSGDRHRRPVRAGTGLGYLQRRPHVHVRRERLDSKTLVRYLVGIAPSSALLRCGKCWKISSIPRSAPSCCRRLTVRLPRKRKIWWVPMSSTTSSCTICSASTCSGHNLPHGPALFCRHLRRRDYQKMAAHRLPPVLYPAVQALLPARWPQSGQRDPLSRGDWRMPSDACSKLCWMKSTGL